MHCDTNSAQAVEPSCQVFHRRFSQQTQVSDRAASEDLQPKAGFEVESLVRLMFLSKLQSDDSAPSVELPAPLLVFTFPPAVSLATKLIVHEPNNAASLNNEIFRFARRPASGSKQAAHGVAHAMDNVVRCVSDEASTERGMEHVGEAQLAQGHGEATAGSVIGCLGEEATFDGRVRRGGGGNEGLGEGGEEGHFQK